MRMYKALDELSKGIMRVEALSLWRRANLQGAEACRRALTVGPCEFANRLFAAPA